MRRGTQTLLHTFLHASVRKEIMLSLGSAGQISYSQFLLMNIIWYVGICSSFVCLFCCTHCSGHCPRLRGSMCWRWFQQILCWWQEGFHWTLKSGFLGRVMLKTGCGWTDYRLEKIINGCCPFVPLNFFMYWLNFGVLKIPWYQNSNVVYLCFFFPLF